MKYLLVDANNMFMRCRHVIKANDAHEKSSMALHLIMNSIRKAWRMFDAQHLVLALDGRSWRKEIYKPYKAQRAEKDALKTAEERNDDKIFFEALHALTEFMTERTNITVLQNEILEADDLISRWVDLHPNDEHIIVSSDADFRQLISTNVRIYDGMKQETVSLDGFITERGEYARDRKTGEPIPPPNPEWILFEKCMRGDTSDNILSAYPGVRKNAIIDAFDDRTARGFLWNNIMNHEWVDHNKVTHKVKTDFERNRLLIDLRAQPKEIIELMDVVISEAVNSKRNSQIGTHFLKFCGKWSLDMLSKSSTEFADILGISYKGELKQQ